MEPTRKQQKVNFTVNQRVDFEDLRDLGDFAQSNLLVALRSFLVPGGINGIVRGGQVNVGTGLQVKIPMPLAAVVDGGIIAVDGGESEVALAVSANAHASWNRVDLVEVGFLWEDDVTGNRWVRDAATDAKSSVSLVTRRAGIVDIKIKQGTAAASPVAPTADSGYLPLADVTVPPNSGTGISVSQRLDNRLTPLVTREWVGTGDNHNFVSGTDFNTFDGSTGTTFSNILNQGYLDLSIPVGATALFLGRLSFIPLGVPSSKTCYPAVLYVEDMTSSTVIGKAFCPEVRGNNICHATILTRRAISSGGSAVLGHRYRLRLHHTGFDTADTNYLPINGINYPSTYHGETFYNSFAAVVF